MDIVTKEQSKAVEGVDLDLDVRIVTAGPMAAALLSSTDDGCDTLKNGDC